MALGVNRQIYATSMDYIATAAMERGGVACAASGSTVSYPTSITPSSVVPVGILLTDVEAQNYLTHPQYMQRNVVDLGSKVAIAQQAEVYTDFIDPYATNHVSAGKVAYLTHSGMLTTWDFAPGVAGANADIGHSGIAVGRFMSECDSNGFAKVYIDIASR